MKIRGGSRWAVVILAVGVWSALMWIPAPLASADHSAVLGITTCEGGKNASASPGEVMTIQLCLTRAGVPVADQWVGFFEQGPSPTDAYESRTRADGRAEVAISSPSDGFSRISACDADQCWDPVVIVWANPGRLPPEDRAPAIPDVLPETFERGPSVARVEHIDTGSPGHGFDCRRGPSTEQVRAPAFLVVVSAGHSKGTHPQTGTETDVFDVSTERGTLPGAAAYGVASVAYVSFAELGRPTDENGAFPYRGFNRQFVFWTSDGVRWGKQEFRFESGGWKEVAPSFLAVLRHARIVFASDVPIDELGRVGGGTRSGDICSGTGLAAVGRSGTPATTTPDSEETSSRAVPLGVALLLLMTALAAAVMQSTEPPPGMAVEGPGGPPILMQRSDIRYDEMARPLGYVDIVELPDGTTRTIRTRIDQEALVLHETQFLDAADWEDPSFATSRTDIVRGSRGQIVSFLEQTTTSEGAVYETTFSNFKLDSHGRVVAYTRSSKVRGRRADTQPRFENFELAHEDFIGEPRTSRLQLSENEAIERADIRLDSDGHVNGYLATIRTDGSGQTLADEAGNWTHTASVPFVMFELGESFGTLPLYRSQPISGFQRARRVLIRWFRRHGCKLELTLLDTSGNPVANAQFRMGTTVGRTDHRGRQTLWVLEQGKYAISVGNEDLEEVLAIQGEAERFTQFVVPRLVGWVEIGHIPGWVRASFEATPVAGHPAAEIGSEAQQ